LSFSVGCIGIYLSRLQPFPEIGLRFAFIVLILALFLWIAHNSPRSGSGQFPGLLTALVGGIAVIIGVRSMAFSNHDVILAPLGGILFSIGVISLLVDYWNSANQLQQIISFIMASVVVLLEIYLVFRGLVVGVPGIAWSKSGLRQIRRGLIEGPNGAISHFERSWDMEGPWINSMSHAALVLIHRKLGDVEEENSHMIELEKMGGWESVDSSWVEAIEGALNESLH